MPPGAPACRSPRVGARLTIWRRLAALDRTRVVCCHRRLRRAEVAAPRCALMMEDVMSDRPNRPGARAAGLLYAVKPWMYRRGRPGRLARAMNRLDAAQFSAGLLSPRRAVTLEVRGRRSGRIISVRWPWPTTRTSSTWSPCWARTRTGSATSAAPAATRCCAAAAASRWCSRRSRLVHGRRSCAAILRWRPAPDRTCRSPSTLHWRPLRPSPSATPCSGSPAPRHHHSPTTHLTGHVRAGHQDLDGQVDQRRYWTTSRRCRRPGPAVSTGGRAPGLWLARPASGWRHAK